MNAPSDKEILLVLVEKLLNSDGTEDQLDEAILQLKQLSAYPDVTDLIFYPVSDMTAEQIVDLIITYKPKLLES